MSDLITFYSVDDAISLEGFLHRKKLAEPEKDKVILALNSDKQLMHLYTFKGEDVDYAIDYLKDLIRQDIRFGLSIETYEEMEAYSYVPSTFIDILNVVSKYIAESDYYV